MADIFLISDTHFGHANILTFLWQPVQGREHLVPIRPGFASVEEMDETMVDNWNRVVRPQDHVWHGGDVVMHWRCLPIVKRLNGHKRLVLGNHDKEDMKKYAEVGFKKIRGSHRVDNVLLTHFPVNQAHLGNKVIGNAHGHIHQNPSPEGPYFNISVENINYTPIPFEVVQKRLVQIREDGQARVRKAIQDLNDSVAKINAG